MRIIFIKRFCTVLFLTLLPALMLSGCFFGLFGGGEKGSTSEVSRTTPPADKVKPALQPRDKLLSRLIDLKNPEYLMPLSSPAPSRSRSRSDAAKNGANGAAQSEVPARAPDFSYRDGILTEDTAWYGDVLIEGGLTISSPDNPDREERHCRQISRQQDILRPWRAAGPGADRGKRLR